jgi:hypothetical protein
MEEQELVRIRSEALSQCRKLCEGKTDDKERLSIRSIKTLLSMNSFAEQIFVLSDHDEVGWILIGVWIERVKCNLG